MTMPGAEPLFFAPKQPVIKLAGYKLPANPRMWQAEIIRYLKSQHPYLPLDTAEINIQRMDAGKGSAVGSIILNNEVAIPVIIARPRPGSDPELSSLDVFFHKGRYQFLDPESIKAVTHSPQIGGPEKGPSSRAVGGNPYIGDMTGDATPLEYSGQASPFAGPFDGTKISSYLGLEKVALSDEAKERAAQAGVLFGLTGGLRGVAKGAGSGGSAKERMVRALIEGGKGAATGAAVGAPAGAATPSVRKALGIEKKEKKREREQIKRVVQKELEKESALDRVLADGMCARLIKNAYLDPNDINNFRQLLASNPHVLQGSGHNHKLLELVIRRGPDTPALRSRKVVGPNIVQVFKGPMGGIFIKFSGGPEQKVSPDELKKAFGDKFPEVMSKLRSAGVYMQHDGVIQSSWNATRPRSEAKPVTRDGLYAVTTANGDLVTGMVCPRMFHFDGRELPLKLIVAADGRYAMAGEMFGVRLSDKHRLPSQVPAAGQTGVFVNYVHGTPVATPPLRLQRISNTSTDNGQKSLRVYHVQDPMTGESFALSPVEGVQGFERLRVYDHASEAASGNPNSYYMPSGVEWVRLREPVTVASSTDALEKISSESSPDVSAVHLVYGGGLFHIDGEFSKEALGAAVGKFLSQGAKQVGGLFKNPKAMWAGAKKTYEKGGIGGVAKKFAPGAAVAGGGLAAGYGGYKAMGGGSGGSGNMYIKQGNLHDFEARELLVAMGMDVDSANQVMDEAREHSGHDRGVKLANLFYPQLRGEEIIEPMEAEYDEATHHFAASLRPSVDLVKAAAESGHPETLDAILSLEFVTPQNMKYFVDNIPDFDEVTSRLAALLIAVRLGMKHVPEEPVRDALEGLSKTVNKLKVLKSAMDHKNERTSSES